MTEERYIGGVIDLSLDSLLKNTNHNSFFEEFNLPQEETLFTFSGRAAFSTILDVLNLSNGFIILPEYICTSAIYPILELRSLEPLKFNLADDFAQETKEVISVINKVKIEKIRGILLCNYFGKNDPEETGLTLKSTYPEVPIILDSVQDFSGLFCYEKRKKWADWQFYSLKKSLPIPDGGILIGPRIGDMNLGISSESLKYSCLNFTASRLRNFILDPSIDKKIRDEIEDIFLDLLSLSKKNHPNNSESITSLSRFLISKIDINNYANIRDSNYKYLSNQLIDLDYIELLQDYENYRANNYLPILVRNKNRDLLQAFLKDKGIFCPIHWPQNEEIYNSLSPNSRNIADNILSLPIDQRYTLDDMSRLFNMIKSFSM